MYVECWWNQTLVSFYSHIHKLKKDNAWTPKKLSNQVLHFVGETIPIGRIIQILKVFHEIHSLAHPWYFSHSPGLGTTAFKAYFNTKNDSAFVKNQSDFFFFFVIHTCWISMSMARSVDERAAEANHRRNIYIFYCHNCYNYLIKHTYLNI